MTIANPAASAVAQDLKSARFRYGVKRGLWRLVNDAFPVLLIAIAGRDGADRDRDWIFRLELSDFPKTPPEARIWDPERQCTLDDALRPGGLHRVRDAFKRWTADTVYRPWERSSGPHFRAVHPQPPAIANHYWSPDKDLVFILEDLHELLNLGLGANAARQAA